MAAMRSPDRGDAAGMARGGEPIVNCGPDCASLDRRLARTVMAGDQQQEAVAAV